MYITCFEIDVTVWQTVLINALEYCKWMLSVFSYADTLWRILYVFLDWLLWPVSNETRQGIVSCSQYVLGLHCVLFTCQPFSPNRIHLVLLSTLIVFWCWHGLINLNIYFSVKDWIWREIELLANYIPYVKLEIIKCRLVIFFNSLFHTWKCCSFHPCLWPVPVCENLHDCRYFF